MDLRLSREAGKTEKDNERLSAAENRAEREK